MNGTDEKKLVLIVDDAPANLQMIGYSQRWGTGQWMRTKPPGTTKRNPVACNHQLDSRGILILV
jgi:hypothetical protein